MRRTCSLLAIVCLFCLPCLLGAQGTGRLQPAVAHAGVFAPQLGKINFPTSCSQQAQPEMEKGVALLHSFQYQQSEQTFAGAAQQDPHCAMAYWGKAMALYHQLWDFPGPHTLSEGRDDLEQAAKIERTTEREREYISTALAFYQDHSDLSHEARARAYSEAMAKLYRDNPKDIDAAAFYGLSLVALAEYNDHDLSDRQKALAILGPLLVADHDHPGVAHYIIHASDTPELASQGLEAARMYAKIAPDSSHALHMPAHIFTRLGLWQESIDSNIAAMAAAAKDTQLHMADAHYETHAMDFLDYAYLQSGQEAKAEDLVKALTSVPGASANTIQNMQAIFEARNALELHHWKAAASLTARDIPLRDLGMTYWVKAIGAARSGDVDGAKQDIQKLIEADEASNKHEKDMGNKIYPGEGVEQREAEAWIAYAEGKSGEAVKTMRQAAEREESEHVDSLTMPAREMLADLLAELKQASEALPEYQAALKISPNRFDSFYGAARAAESAGKPQEAREYFARLAKITAPGADRPELQEIKVNMAGK
jgi:tetratricopeptide (TPR) repeat protein